MNKVDRQAQMMDYLYGEMTEPARREYERWLEQHPDVRREVEEMQGSRQWLSEVEDVIPQPLIVDLPPRRRLDRKWLYRIASAAAVILMLWLFNFQVRTEQGGLVLSFGHPESIDQPDRQSPEPTDALPAEVWQQLLADNQQLLEDKLMRMDSSWQGRFAALQNENQQQWRQVKHTQAQQVVQVRQEFMDKELPRLAGIMQRLQMDQKEELQLLFVEFWNTWMETRQNDLEQIDYRMTNLYQNVERSQQASEARVVNYIQNVAGK